VFNLLNIGKTAVIVQTRSNEYIDQGIIRNSTDSCWHIKIDLLSFFLDCEGDFVDVDSLFAESRYKLFWIRKYLLGGLASLEVGEECWLHDRHAIRQRVRHLI
jgi:hypothetical protein